MLVIVIDPALSEMLATATLEYCSFKATLKRAKANLPERSRKDGHNDVRELWAQGRGEGFGIQGSAMAVQSFPTTSFIKLSGSVCSSGDCRALVC